MNEHITENLENYLTIEKPQYAVLLSGKWGCGKTFFIDEFVKSKQSKDKKFIKVSLFGLKNISEVNNQIILQLLNAKGICFGQIAKSALSYTKELNLSIQDLPIDKIFKKLNKELIFIFDDLERSNIKYSEILGYINYFVEQSGFKVIILADDTKITDGEFIEFKEKVIGKTFEIQQDFDAVLTVFLDLVSKSKEILTGNKQQIKTIYDKAGYNNLRHIRQTILDFEYFYSHIEGKFTKNNNFLKDLIYLFFVFSIEIKKGKLKVGGINEYFKDFPLIDKEKTDSEETEPYAIALKSMRRDEIFKKRTISDNNLDKYFFSKEKMPFDMILNKYSFSNDSGFVLGKENWENILFKGNIIKDAINAAINDTSYFATNNKDSKDNRESWIRLWHFDDLEDEEFKTTLDDVLEKFNHNKYLEHEKLLHVVAILLHLSKQGFYDKAQENILAQAKNNIDANVATPYWQQNRYRHNRPIGAYLLAYIDHESDQFQKIVSYLIQKSQEAFNIRLKAKDDGLLQDFKNNDIKALKAKLLGELSNISIFSQINVADFINILLKVKHTNLSYIFSVLKQRYPDNKGLTQDLEFWQGVDKSLLGKIDKDKQQIKYFLMNGFKGGALKEIITSLEKQESE